MKFDCSLETRHSEKKNTNYKVFVITITPDYKITFFPKSEQLKLIEVLTKNQAQMPDIPFFSQDEVSSLNN